MLNPDYRAEADLHMIAPMQSEPRSSPKYIEIPLGVLAPVNLGALIKHVMAKRPADREIFSIMVGEKVYYSSDIDYLYNSADFPTELKTDGHLFERVTVRCAV